MGYLPPAALLPHQKGVVEADPRGKGRMDPMERGAHSEARLSLCRTVQRLLRDDIASIREAIAQAPGDPELMSKLCRSLFSHERGKHYGKFKAAFVLNKIEL